MQNIFTDFEHPTQGVAMEFIGLAARLDYIRNLNKLFLTYPFQPPATSP